MNYFAYALIQFNMDQKAGIRECCADRWLGNFGVNVISWKLARKIQ